jgi:hypothetical protein
MRRLAEPGHEPPQSPAAIAGAVVGALGGMALANYTGASLWIPAIATGLLALLFAKTPLAPPRFRGAIAITGGHIVWFIAAAALTGGWAQVGLDIAALGLACAIAWVVPKPAGAALLGLVQLGSLGYNGSMLIEASFGSQDHRALVVHVLWRVFALVAIVAEVLAMRREAAGEPPGAGTP